MTTSPEKSLVQEHELKTWPDYFRYLVDGTKTFEYRRNDRGFKVGDVLYLREWEPTFERYTGREMRRTVTYLLPVSNEFVVMALSPLAEQQRLEAENRSGCGCRNLGDGTGTECAAHEEQRTQLEAAESALTAKDEERRSLRSVYEQNLRIEAILRSDLEEEFSRRQSAEAKLRSLREASAAIAEDLTEALATPKPSKRGICSSCGTDHDNEVRLNRAVWAGLRLRLRNALTSPPGAPAATSPSEKTTGLHGSTVPGNSGVGAPRRENQT